MHSGSSHWGAAAVPGLKGQGGNSGQGSEEVKTTGEERAPAAVLQGVPLGSFMRVTLASVLPLLSTVAQNQPSDLFNK